MNAISPPIVATKVTAGTLRDKYDIVVLVEAINANPNGDPDSGNQPRIDPVTSTGMITNVCLKRKIRDYLAEIKGVELYHANGVVLREQRAEALAASGIVPSGDADAAEGVEVEAKGKKQKSSRAAVTGDDLRRNQHVICAKYYDARAFGAVMDTGAARAANARGPVAVSMAMSVDPIRIIDNTITRQSVETPEERTKERMMGSQPVVRYGLYRFDMTVHPFHAQRTGFTPADLDLLHEAIVGMFELDQASTRRLSLRGVYAFQHASQDGQPCLGHAPRHSLIERVVAQKRTGVGEPLAFSDYDVLVDLADLPAGISMHRWA
jgi:CRISPR-associated protein Csd2